MNWNCKKRTRYYGKKLRISVDVPHYWPTMNTIVFTKVLSHLECPDSNSASILWFYNSLTHSDNKHSPTWGAELGELFY